MYHAKNHSRRRALRNVPRSPDDPRPWRPEPGSLRRLVIVIDYDTGRPLVHTTALYATRRIDCYRVMVKGVVRHFRAGWSVVCRDLRMMLPRVSARA